MPEAIIPFCSIFCEHEKVENITQSILCTYFLFLPEPQKLLVCEKWIGLYDTFVFPQATWAQSSYLIITTCWNNIMVPVETRLREAISFTKHNRMGHRQSGEENPGLFEWTHINFILQGEEVESKIGNRTRRPGCRNSYWNPNHAAPWPPMWLGGVCSLHSCWALSQHFSPRIILLGRTLCREMLAGVCTWQSYIMYLMSKWNV